MNAKAWLVVAGVALMLGGCAANGGAWTASGFEQQKYGWKASYAPGQRTLVSDDWRLDNWVPAPQGGLQEASAPPYVINLAPPRSLPDNYYLYDLRFTNVHDNGVIWVKTRTLEARDAAKDLDVLLDNYALSVTEAPLMVPKAILTQSLVGVGFVARRITSRTEIKLGPYRALSAAVDAEAVNVPGTPSALRIIVIRFDYWGEAESVGNGAGAGSGGSPSLGRPVRTALMVIGYANDLRHFEAGLADLARFVERLSFSPPPPASLSPSGGQGSGGDAPKAAPTATPGDAPQAPRLDQPVTPT